MEEVPYEAEERLQELLASHPALLAGDETGAEMSWLLVQRELGVASEIEGAARWSLDHLFLDREGVPTLVEVKRSSDTRIRREVVGQMLDYAANGSTVWSEESIRSSFEESTEDPDRTLAEFLHEEDDPDGFWERVGLNLKVGRFRLVFVADEIPSELRRIIEFLNAQMTETEVIGVEVKRFRQEDGDLVSYVSNVIGRTEVAKRAKRSSSGPGPKWTIEGLERALTESHGRETAVRAMELRRRLIDAGAQETVGKGKWEPSANYRLAAGTATPVSLSIYVSGLALNFAFLEGDRSEDEMRRLLSLAAQIPGAEPYLEAMRDGNWARRPTMAWADVLTDDASARRIADLMIEASRSVSSN